MTRIQVSLTSYANTTHIPLAALGYALRRAGVLQPLDHVMLPIKAVEHTPSDKLIEALVLVLAGGRATYQADLLLRPNRALAQAWGQVQFAQQATLAHTLDAFEGASLATLRATFEAILRQQSWTVAHDFRSGPLRLEGDLTGLPATQHAEGSTKGYFGGEKTVAAGKSRGLAPRTTMKRSARCCTPARPTVWRLSSRWSCCRNACWGWRRGNASVPRGVWMAALGVMRASTGCWHATINWSPRATVRVGHRRWWLKSGVMPG